MRTTRESCRRLLFLFIVGAAFFGFTTRGQQAEEAWQVQVRKDTDTRRWDDALRLIDQETARSPDDMDIHALRARVLTWAGRLAEAEREYGEVLKVERNDPDSWMGLGSVYMQQGRMAEAIKAANRAIELDPQRHIADALPRAVSDNVTRPSGWFHSPRH